MTSILDATIIHHVIIVLLVLWLLNSFNCCSPIAYLGSLIYLYLVHERYVMRLRKKVQFEERRHVNQRKALSDSETVRWLNLAIEKIWSICMENIVSQKILLPIIPWFLQKYKPWTVKEAVVQQLYLGRSPPIFTDIRVLRDSYDDDHLVLEMGLSFQTADDMSGILAAKLRRRLGLGIWTKMHLVGMHVEGKVLVGVKFIRQWPFLGRLRVCFAEPPYFQMMVKPLFTHGLDVTELPGVAGWLDKLLGVAFEQTLVEPNMLVVDVEKFASPEQGSWFSVNVKEPIAHALVEVLEADEMKPSDLNGLADPYVKGQLGPYRFRTQIQKKTLAPKWHEEFKVPICTWESPILKIEVRDKDHLVDDKLGVCSININDLRDGQRHDMWLSLQNIKVGRLHLAITIVEGKGEEKVAEEHDPQNLNSDKAGGPVANDATDKAPSPAGTNKISQRVQDKFEPIDIVGQQETGIWIHHPGSEVAQIWEPRKGRNWVGSQIRSENGDGSGSFKSTGSESCQDDGSSTDESVDADKSHSRNPFRRGWQKMGSMFHRTPKGEKKSIFSEEPVPSPHANVRSVDSRVVGVKFVVDDSVSAPSCVKSPGSVPSSLKSPEADEKESSDGSGVEVEAPNKGRVKGAAKNIIKQAGKSAHDLKNALGRKISKKSKSEAGSLPPDRDIKVDYDSSDESSPSSVGNPVDNGGFVVSTSLTGSGSASFKSNECKTPTTPDIAPNTVETISIVEATSAEDAKPSILIPEQTDGLNEISAAPIKLAEEKSEAAT